MSDVNQFNCTCGIVSEPELSYTASGTALCRFRVAITNYKNESQYFTVKAWETLAENMNKFFKVGTQIFLTGRLNVDSWENKEGEKRQDIVIYAERFDFLNSSKPKKSESTNTNSEAVAVSIDSDEDIPF